MNYFRCLILVLVAFMTNQDRSHMGPGGCLEPKLESDTETTPPVRTISHECLLQVLLVNFTCASHDFELVPPA